MSLTREEYYLLLLAEEATEVAQAASKCIRFGASHQYAGYDRSNIANLKLELNDMLCMIEELEKLGHDLSRDEALIAKKRKRLVGYSDISFRLGVVNDLTG